MSNPIYQQAIYKWGTVSQVNQAIEECSELILALRHYDRGKATLENVASEIADVEIMCAQLRCVFGQFFVDQAKDGKLKRLEGLLGEGEG